MVKRFIAVAAIALGMLGVVGTATASASTASALVHWYKTVGNPERRTLFNHLETVATDVDANDVSGTALACSQLETDAYNDLHLYSMPPVAAIAAQWKIALAALNGAGVACVKTTQGNGAAASVFRAQIAREKTAIKRMDKLSEGYGLVLKQPSPH